MMSGGPRALGGSVEDVRDPEMAACHIGGAMAAIEASVYEIKDAVLAVVDRYDAQVGHPNRGDLEALQPLLERLLESHRGLVAGAGFVVEPGIICDAREWLEWRMGRRGSFARLEVTLDSNSLTHYDYLHAAWYEGPRSGAARTLTGPYVDLGGVNQYIVTLTIPVTLGSRFLGVAGADVLVDRVEVILRHLTRAMSRGAIVLTEEGRILASSVPSQHPGALIHGVDLSVESGQTAAPGLVAYRCGSLPWTLLVAEPAHSNDHAARTASLN